MSQRGGDVQSNLRISSDPIRSDLIALGGADVIISMEPMEALRYLPYLNKNGWIITSSAPYVNIPNYPDMDVVMGDLQKVENVIVLDIEKAAKDNGVPRSAWPSGAQVRSKYIVLGSHTVYGMALLGIAC